MREDCKGAAQLNFKIGGELMPLKVVHALGVCKYAAATVNERLGLLDSTLGAAIRSACQVGGRSFPAALRQHDSWHVWYVLK